MRNISLVLLFIFLFLAGIAFADQNSKAEFSYREGKKSFARGDFSAAIEKFEQVVDLEEGKSMIYTPYAKNYITQAQAKLEKEQLNSDMPQAAVNVPTAEISATDLEYKIGLEDELFISVWKEDLNQDATVRPDGKISVYLVGDIYVQGLTFNKLKQLLEKKLKEYIKFPEISVTLRKMGGKRIIILGEVKSPGVYTLTRGKTILEAISLAQGFTKDAVGDSILLISGGLQRPQGRRLDLNKLMSRADMSDNVILQAEDIIYVPRTFIADLNYTLGQIVSPLYQGVFVRQALSQ